MRQRGSRPQLGVCSHHHLPKPSPRPLVQAPERRRAWGHVLSPGDLQIVPPLTPRLALGTASVGPLAFWLPDLGGQERSPGCVPRLQAVWVPLVSGAALPGPPGPGPRATPSPIWWPREPDHTLSTGSSGCLLPAGTLRGHHPGSCFHPLSLWSSGLRSTGPVLCTHCPVAGWSVSLLSTPSPVHYPQSTKVKLSVQTQESLLPALQQHLIQMKHASTLASDRPLPAIATLLSSPQPPSTGTTPAPTLCGLPAFLPSSRANACPPASLLPEVSLARSLALGSSVACGGRDF